MSDPIVVALLDTDQADPAEEGAPGVRLRPVRTLDELVAALPGARAAVMWEFRSDLLEPGWEHAGALEWLHVAGAGLDGALFPAIVESPVVVTNARGASDGPVAEHALALLLALVRELPETLRLQSERTWRHRLTRTLAGKRLVVVGAGSIGGATARLARAFGMSVVGVARSTREDGDYDEVAAIGELARCLAEADHVVVTLPLTEETRGLLGDDALAALRPDTMLVNVGRGAVIDEAALLRALDDGRLAGAALDVFAQEPLPSEHPLWRHPRVIVSPHVGAAVDGIYEAVVAQWRENVARGLAGEPLHGVTDKRLYRLRTSRPPAP